MSSMSRPTIAGRPQNEQRPTYFERLQSGAAAEPWLQQTLAMHQEIQRTIKDLPGDNLIDVLIPLRTRLVRLHDLIPKNEHVEHHRIFEAIFELGMLLVDTMVEVMEQNISKGWKPKLEWKKQMAAYLKSLDKIVQPAARMGMACSPEWEYQAHELSDLCGWMETHAGLFASLGVCSVYDFMEGTRNGLEDWADQAEEVEGELEEDGGFDPFD